MRKRIWRWVKLQRHGVKRPKLVIAEAERAHLDLADAVTMLEQETGIPQKNIFGCDMGIGNLFCHLRVTRERVRKLIRSGRAQGVGWTQITYQGFVTAAQAMGGAWKPKFQMREGFAVLASNIRTYGVQEGHARYNGTGPAAEEYGRRAMTLRAKWQRILS